MTDRKHEVIGSGLPSEQARNTVLRPAAEKPAPKKPKKESKSDDE